MPITNQEWASQIVRALIQHGVDTFFISPGSRSTPLTAALARVDGIRTIVHYDERGSAFAALGYGRGRSMPAAWITTSGTAVANGFPAVIEAEQDEVPLLLLTADRPPELRATSANQTIDQVKIFGKFTRFFFDVPPPDPSLSNRFVDSLIGKAVAATKGNAPGPVHLNCMFREPLAPEVAPSREKILSPQVEPSVVLHAIGAPGSGQFESVRSIVSNTRRGLVVAGRIQSKYEATHIQRLALSLGWPLLADVLSQSRHKEESQEVLIPFYDMVLCSEEFITLNKPETILYFGKPGVSKRLQSYLAGLEETIWIQISPSNERIDPALRVDIRVESPIPFFCESMENIHKKTDEGWLKNWQASSRRCEQILTGDNQDILDEVEAVSLLHNAIQPSHVLFLGNSLPVRISNSFAPLFKGNIHVAANRGASGIDGLLATAMGLSVGSRKPCIALLGDLSLLHDLNSLGLLKENNHPLIVIVLNNDGGGIFSFLPIAGQKDIFNAYFATPHGRTFRQAASMYDILYAQPATLQEFKEVLERAIAGEENIIIEVLTTRETTHARIRALENAMRNA